MDSLQRVLELDLETIYPAHGPVIRNPKEKIREYIAHRELRERQILAGLSDGPLDAMGIVKKIYVDVPEYLHPAAASSVRSHLRKLERESRVVENEKRWSTKYLAPAPVYDRGECRDCARYQQIRSRVCAN